LSYLIYGQHQSSQTMHKHALRNCLDWNISAATTIFTSYMIKAASYLTHVSPLARSKQEIG